MKDLSLSKSSKTLKIIKTELSIEEHDLVCKRTKDQGISIKQYIRDCVLNPEMSNPEKRRRIAAMMPDYYQHVKRIPDQQLRRYFQEVGEEICQSLK